MLVIMYVHTRNSSLPSISALIIFSSYPYRAAAHDNFTKNISKQHKIRRVYWVRVRVRVRVEVEGVWGAPLQEEAELEGLDSAWPQTV